MFRLTKTSSPIPRVVTGSIRSYSKKNEEVKKIGKYSKKIGERIINEYIPFNKFPRAPDSILNQSSKQLYESIDLNYEDNSNSQTNGKLVDFVIPEKHLKSHIQLQITDKDRAVVEEIDNLSRANDEKEINQLNMSVLKLYYDEDLNSYQPMIEHNLKKSLSGMIKLNEQLHDIDDEYLWNLFPRNQNWSTPPFEKKFEGIDGFKKWEKQQIDKINQQKLDQQKTEQDVLKFKQRLQKNDYKIFAKKDNKGRKKLDRSLLKQYKKLKAEGKFPDPSNKCK